MIYLDNSSTTRKKPKEVMEAFNYYVEEIGVSPARGSYSLGIEASRMLYQARKNISDYFGLSKANVVFTKNSTEAINLFLNGFLERGDHVLLTCYEHNAVFRPLNKLKNSGIIEYSVIKRDDMTLTPEALIKKYVKSNTKLFVSTLASNVTGRIVFDKQLFKHMKELGITTFLDSSQGAGKYRVSMVEDSVDYLAFTGHKDLLAFPGVGGLCSQKKIEFTPLIQGGTGVFGDNYINPKVYPDAYEAGTLNMPAIWSLNASINYIKTNFNKNQEQEQLIHNYLVDSLKKLDNIVIYDLEFSKLGAIGINIHDVRSDDVVRKLDENDICVRGGIHCAILTHESLGTNRAGVVRISPNFNNNKEDIDALTNILKEIH